MRPVPVQGEREGMVRPLTSLGGGLASSILRGSWPPRNEETWERGIEVKRHFPGVASRSVAGAQQAGYRAAGLVRDKHGLFERKDGPAQAGDL